MVREIEATEKERLAPWTVSVTGTVWVGAPGSFVVNLRESPSELPPSAPAGVAPWMTMVPVCPAAIVPGADCTVK